MNPWSITTLNEVVKLPPNRDNDYVTTCHSIFSDVEVVPTKRHMRIVSVQRTRDKTTRLYKLASEMRKVIDAKGRL